jgi:hypothetical protein
MTGSGRGGTGNATYRRNRLIVLALSDVCGICGHHGAMTADHIIPPKDWPRGLPGLDDITNLRPAHGTMGAGRGRRVNACSTCGRVCNQSRGNRAARRPASREWFPNGVPRG